MDCNNVKYKKLPISRQHLYYVCFHCFGLDYFQLSEASRNNNPMNIILKQSAKISIPNCNLLTLMAQGFWMQLGCGGHNHGRI